MGLIRKATSSILITTSAFEESQADKYLTGALIQRVKNDGLDIRVIVDRVTLYCLHQKKKVLDEISIYKLVKGGIRLQMLDA